MQNSLITVMTCTESDGNLLFNRLFLDYEKAVKALKTEYEGFLKALLEDVPEEQIECHRGRTNASVTWIEEGEPITYNFFITEEGIEE